MRAFLSIFLFLFLSSPYARTQIITTIAGNGTTGGGGNNGPATAASLWFVNRISVDDSNNLFISSWNDAVNYCAVRKVNSAGIISAFAGNDTMGFSGDGGPATAAGLGTISDICMDTADNLYIIANGKIRKVDTAGIITTFAGNGTNIHSGDGGPATTAGIGGSGQIVFDKYGNLIVAENGSAFVRKIDASGIITTIAGNGSVGYSGDGGPATAAKLNRPTGVFPDDCDNVYIVDSWNNRVRIVNGSGMIKTFAGNWTGIGGSGSFGGDGGPATAAEFYTPTNMCIDKHGNIYIADWHNIRVRYIHMDSCRNTTDVPVSEVAAAGLTVEPNPSAGDCSIKLSSPVDEPVAVVVTDVTGIVVMQLTTITNHITALQLHVAAGIYFVTVTTSHGRWAEKIMIE